MLIMDEVMSKGCISLSVDSTPDPSHTDQLSVVLRYVVDGESIERYKVTVVKAWLRRSQW